MPPVTLLKTLNPSRLKTFLLIFSFLLIFYLLFHRHAPLSHLQSASQSPLTRRHLLFAVASSYRSWPSRKSYVRLWYSPNSTRALAYLDRVAPDTASDDSVPPVVVSEDTSKFPYTFPRGLRSAIRVARVVKEVVDRDEKDVRWYVFGDDDTVFVVDNLVKTLAKYDHERWFYIGSNSEGYYQNVKNSFEMAFGGGGFAISYSLARVLARVLDSCLVRYAHLYGSDSRIFSCLAELGVGLTHEPGFHQVDMRGNLFGLLSSHPLAPLVSLHHLDAVDPIFPNMSRTLAMGHLFEAVNVDPGRILQQTVCYDPSNSLTVSVAWGYAIQVFEGNEYLPDLLLPQKTFMPWKRGVSIDASRYMFRTREYPKDPCKRPLIFFLESVIPDKGGVWSYYTGHMVGECDRPNAIKNLTRVKVFSKTLELDLEQRELLKYMQRLESSEAVSGLFNFWHANCEGMYPLSPALGRRWIWRIGTFPMLDFRSDAGKVRHQGSQSSAGVSGSQIQQSMAATPVSKNFLVTRNVSMIFPDAKKECHMPKMMDDK